MIDYIVFDLETTGLSPVASEIVEIGAWKIKNSVAVSKFETLVKPKGFYGKDVQDLNHITSEMLADAVEIEEVLPSFIDFCEDLPLLGHNLSFDYDFICTKARAIGYDFTLDGKRKGIDTLELSRLYCKNVSHKLQDMANLFHIQLSGGEGYHRAGYDSYITKLIYDRFVVMAENLSPSAKMRILEPDLIIKGNTEKYGKADNNGVLRFK